MEMMSGYAGYTAVHNWFLIHQAELSYMKALFLQLCHTAILIYAQLRFMQYVRLFLRCLYHKYNFQPALTLASAVTVPWPRGLVANFSPQRP
jgi:hypothetical protein